MADLLTVSFLQRALIAAYLYVVETVASVHAPHCIAAIVLLAAQAHSHPPDQTLRVRVAVCC